MENIDEHRKSIVTNNSKKRNRRKQFKTKSNIPNSNQNDKNQKHKDGAVITGEKKANHYYWSHCADHLRYSMKIAKKFLDPTREETFNNRTFRSVNKLIVIQNNKASRKVFKNYLIFRCFVNF